MHQMTVIIIQDYADGKTPSLSMHTKGLEAFILRMVVRIKRDHTFKVFGNLQPHGEMSTVSTLKQTHLFDR